MAFAISHFNPIVAFGIEDEKTLTATPSEGATVVAFDNSGATVVVGDPIFVRSADDTVLQYMGLATVASTTQITVQVPLQDAVGASATLWVPSSFVRFTGEQRGSQRHTDDDGASTVVTNGGAFFGFQAKDPSNTVSLGFSVRNSTAYADWRTFRVVDRVGATKSFNLAYYDNLERKGKTIKCKVMAGTHNVSTVNQFVTRFSEVFGVEKETPSVGVYVES